MDLTASYSTSFPEDVLSRYEFRETRNAAAVFKASNPSRFEEVVAALRQFELMDDDLIRAGGNESKLAARLNQAFRSIGWREARVDVLIKLSLLKRRYAPAGETGDVRVETEVVNEGYKVDNFVDRIALDVEWNAKDGNLDRDLAAYRALYDQALIDVATIITRTQTDLRQLAYRLATEAGSSTEAAKRLLGTTTTTNTEKLLPRMQRGDGGGCPVLVVAICSRTWHGANAEQSSA